MLYIYIYIYIYTYIHMYACVHVRLLSCKRRRIGKSGVCSELSLANEIGVRSEGKKQVHARKLAACLCACTRSLGLWLRLLQLLLPLARQPRKSLFFYLTSPRRPCARAHAPLYETGLSSVGRYEDGGNSKRRWQQPNRRAIGDPIAETSSSPMPLPHRHFQPSTSVPRSINCPTMPGNSACWQPKARTCCAGCSFKRAQP